MLRIPGCRLAIVTLVAAALASSACTVSSPGGAVPGSGASGGTSGSGGVGGGSPVGPVAHDAAEAFPNRPASLPVLGPSDIARSCALYVACQSASAHYTQQDELAAELLCVGNVTWSAERAIPMSYLSSYNERAEYFVPCVLGHVGDCKAIAACATGRSSQVRCQEDGCQGPDGAQVTCQGTVATVTAGGEAFTRDCALADAECDPSSPTGCTDRHFTRCPAGTAGNRCDGNVRLGCDSAGQVSYHDCARMGGVCGNKPDGHQGCIYNGGVTDSSCTSSSPALPSCSGSTLSLCINDRLVSVDAPELCSP